jgi:hypothetical protein
LQAVNLQAIAGGDVGTIATSINYANNAAYADGFQRIMGDEQWQEFLGARRGGWLGGAGGELVVL